MLKTLKINFSAAETDDKTPAKLLALSKDLNTPVNIRSPELASSLQNLNEEHASRLFLQSYLESLGQEDLTELTAPDRPEIMPDLIMKKTHTSKLISTRTVEFLQTSHSIPIFGAKATVEIDSIEHSLVGIDADLVSRPDVSPLAEISASDALNQITQFSEGESSQHLSASPPNLVFFADEENDKWRLAFHFEQVSIAPKQEETDDNSNDSYDFCLGESPRHDSLLYDYFVDAHSGEVFYYFSSTPRLDIPTLSTGMDEHGINRDFSTLFDGSKYLMYDPIRNIKTYDYNFKDLNKIPTPNLPHHPIKNGSASFSNVNNSAVSAHANATLVFDFYNDVLKRNGIDDQGMAIESAINSYYSKNNINPYPEWVNAVWWKQKMWYGQTIDKAGNTKSLARYLDVIGHELTHGVTQTSANLIYKGLSGALNESFSDIFGVIINNWYPGAPNSIDYWNWKIGDGLGPNGGPMRDFSDPSATNHPTHFNQYKPITKDHGGVHIYSGIHNLAAYKVLTTKTASNYLFNPEEVAILYYLTLTKLNRRSVFTDCRRTILNVASLYYANDPNESKNKTKAIRAAYKSVGIV